MNTRQVLFVRKLLAETEYRTASFYAELLMCSERTVQYDVDAINVVLAARGLESAVRGRRGFGLRLELREEERTAVEELVKGGTFGGDVETERFVKALLHVACPQGKPPTRSELAGILCVNLNQLRRDMHRWNGFLTLCGCSIGVDGRGRCVMEGDEACILQGITFLVQALAPVALRDEAERYFGGETQTMMGIVGLIESGLSVRFSFNARCSAAFFLSLVSARIRNGREFSAPLDTAVERPGLEFVWRRIGKHAGRALSSQERAAIAGWAECSAVNTVEVQPIAAGPIWEEARQWTTDFLAKLARICAIDADSAAAADFTAVFYRAIQRVRARWAVPFRSAFSTRCSNAQWFLLTSALLHPVEERFGQRLFGGDVDRLSLLVQAWLDGRSPFKTLNAALVVNSGIEQAKFTSARIARLVPELRISQVASDADFLFEEGGADAIDCLVTHDHLSFELPACQISYGVVGDDIGKLRRFSKSILLERSRERVAIDKTPISVSSSEWGDVVRAVYEDFRTCFSEDWSLEGFAFEAQRGATVIGDRVQVLLCAPSVKRTRGRIFRAPRLYLGRSIQVVGVLVVDPADAEYLPGIVRCFFELLHLPDEDPGSYELPIAAG